MRNETQVVGIIGTAKNTGKTTTLSAIINYFSEKEILPGLTSIGYDGEDLDNLTYLPKPKLRLRKNTIAATSELCLKNTKAKFEILTSTDIITPLGTVKIIKITQEGEMVLAGPNNIKDLTKIITLLKKYDCEFIFIDGALNRMAPMYLADKIIISTGASRNTDINILVNEMKSFSELLQFPKADKIPENIKTIQLFDKGITDTNIFSLMDSSDYDQLISFRPERFRRIFMPNIFAARLMYDFLLYVKNTPKKIIDIIFFEPFRVILSTGSEIFFNNNMFNNIKFSYCIKPEFLAVTVNPFYPRLENFHFRPDYIDKKLLLSSMKNNIQAPVFNIMESGIESIIKLLQIKEL